MAKILIIDDSNALRNELRLVLEGNSHEVLEAENGVQGLEILSKNPTIDLIVLDIHMPKMDGITMCERIHEKDDLKNIPIVMLTTVARPELKEKAKLLGVKAWVTKPLVPDRFLIGVNKILSKKDPILPAKHKGQ